VNRFEHFILNTAEEGVAFVERINSPSCRLHLDTFHMNIEEDNLRDRLEIFKHRGRVTCAAETADAFI
jgi:D-psicose/D-tagatose/L-ribulose 3-epimerase